MKHVYHCIGHALKIPNIVQGDGVYIVDDQGRRYMDLESGVWCISLGHGNRRVNEAIARQCDAIIQAGFCYSSQIVDAAAERVLAVAGVTSGKCVFLCSGSEAVEISRQIAKHVTGFGTSMTLHDSYLGAYSSVTDRRTGWCLFDWRPCEACESSAACSRDCDRLRRIPPDIADFVFEPGSSSGFVRFPPKALIRNLADIVRENGGMVIVNEVTTGVGRTGKWFGFQHYDLAPDMIAVGKGIGNGYPVSVAAINERTIEALDAKPFKYSQSHQNDPLGAAVVKAVIEVIDAGDLVAGAARKGATFLPKLSRLIDKAMVLDVRGRGLMVAVDIVDEATTSRLQDGLIRKGFVVGNRGGALRIDPPLTITESELDGFVAAFQATLAEIEGAPIDND